MTASAPSPSQVERSRGRSRFDRTFKLTLTEPGKERRTLELAAADLGPRDDRISRQQAGFPVEQFILAEKLGADSVVIMWWMARRHNGEPNLSYPEVERLFPSYRELEAADPVVEVIEPDEDDDPDGVIEVDGRPLT